MSVKRIIELTKKYIYHILAAKNEHSIHSPFLFKLYTQVLVAPKKYYAFQDLVTLREDLQKNHQTLKVNDLGTGSHRTVSDLRKVSQIARHSSIPTKQGELLFRLLNYLEPKVIFELGTSLGMGTLYMQLAFKNAQVFTFEGAENIVNIAKDNFKQFEVSPTIIEGDIDATLPIAITKVEQIDFAYIDANHNYEATMNYFKLLLQKMHEDSVVFIDDIRWSKEMENAWKEIINMEIVTLSLDFFNFGIVFFRKKQPKQHFHLNY